MIENLRIATITILDKDSSYRKVGEILHKYSSKILLRVGYPIKESNIAIIFLVMNLSNDESGAFSGKIGQITSVKIKINKIKM